MLTFDIMFDDPELYCAIRDAGVIDRERIARLYGQAVEDVLFFYYDNALAIKFSIPRPISSGDLEDSDVFGGQQYAPLMEIEIPDETVLRP